MKKNILKMNFLFIIIAVMFSACQKDKIGEGNDEELITTMTLTFTPVNGGTALTYGFNDPDGPGGISPQQDEIILTNSTLYEVEIKLLNTSENPPIDITEEVLAEAEAHRFFYETTAGIAFSNFNKDSNAVSVGTRSTWNSGPAGTGNIKITLRHYIGTPPDKQESDLANSAKSVSDIELTFNTTIL
jgi:hypothetical protein